MFQRRLAEAYVRWGRKEQARSLYEDVLETMRANGLENERGETLLAYADLLSGLEEENAALRQEMDELEARLSALEEAAGNTSSSSEAPPFTGWWWLVGGLVAAVIVVGPRRRSGGA